jgi:hypothetical protein
MRSLLARGEAAAVMEAGTTDCPHIVKALGLTLVPGPEDWPMGTLAQWAPLPFIQRAYDDVLPARGRG